MRTLVVLPAAGPLREPGTNQTRGERIEFGLARHKLGLDTLARFRQSRTAHLRVEIVRGLRQRLLRQAFRQRQNPVFHAAIVAHQHEQRALGVEAHKFDVLDPADLLFREHDAGTARQAGQHVAGFRQHPGCTVLIAAELPLKPVAFGIVDGANFEQPVHEKPQPRMRRNTARADMRRIDESQRFEVGHHIPHRGRRQRHGQMPAEVSRPHGLARREIRLHDAPENLPVALVELA